MEVSNLEPDLTTATIRAEVAEFEDDTISQVLPTGTRKVLILNNILYMIFLNVEQYYPNSQVESKHE
jgi:hypothetical protein